MCITAHQTSSLELFYLSFSFLLCNEFSKFFNEIPSHFSVLFRNFFVVQFSKTKRTRCSQILLYFISRLCALKLTAYLLYIKDIKLSSLFLKKISVFFDFCKTAKKVTYLSLFL